MSRASERSIAAQDGGKAWPSTSARSGAHVLSFPESFQRTAPLDTDTDRDRDRDMSDSTNESTPSSEINLAFNTSAYEDTETEGVPSRSFSSRSGNVMRLENILNAVSIDYDDLPVSVGRSRSLGSQSPLQAEITQELEPVSCSLQAESPDAESGSVKKKKVKMHRCPECHKDFPRPSGLRTHMNIHTKEKPFSCTYPGCARTFSVVSNAKRHMRTHGTSGGGLDEIDGGAPAPYYNVGFEPPVVVGDEEEAGRSRAPVRLRWPSASTEHGKRVSGSGRSAGVASSAPSSVRAESAIARRASVDVGVAPEGKGPHKIRTTTSLPRR